MRWLLGVVSAVILLVLIYFGSAAGSLAKLAASVRAGDGAAVLERTDLKTLNRSLPDQIVRAYLERIVATRQIKPMEKLLSNTNGATIAHAMVAKMLTAARLTRIVKTGGLTAPETPPLAESPA